MPWDPKPSGPQIMGEVCTTGATLLLCLNGVVGGAWGGKEPSSHSSRCFSTHPSSGPAQSFSETLGSTEGSTCSLCWALSWELGEFYPRSPFPMKIPEIWTCGVASPLKCPSPMDTVCFSHRLRAQPGRGDGDPGAQVSLDEESHRDPVGDWKMPTVNGSGWDH